MKQNKTRKRSRITFQIASYMTAMVISVVLLCFLINTVTLGIVYQVSKQNSMIEAYEELNSKCLDGSIYEGGYQIELERISVTDNLAIIVISSNGTVMLSTTRNKMDYIYVERLIDSVFDRDGSASSPIKNTDSYIIEKQVDEKLGGEYLVLWGYLDDGNIIMIRCTIESIMDSASVSNKFFGVVGLISIFFSIFVATIFSRLITQPIVELTGISKRMKAFDFNVKYTPRKRANEVDELGVCMNEMSYQLEATINDLKTANEKLQADIELKEKTEEMRKEFLSNVSHELKTPIALIQGYAEGLSEGVSTDPEDVKYYCDVIVDEAEKMNRIVKELLNLNQIEYGSDIMTYEVFDITAMIRGVILSCNILSEQYGAEIIFNFDKQINVYADEFFIEQVINNYLTNAIHYAKYEKQIIVDIIERDSEVEVSVFNTGDKIPDESLGHIFDKFYKVDKARTREYGGSGIGLSVVKAVMNGHNKSFGVRNLDNGVSFWFVLDKEIAENR